MSKNPKVFLGLICYVMKLMGQLKLTGIQAELILHTMFKFIIRVDIGYFRQTHLMVVNNG